MGRMDLPQKFPKNKNKNKNKKVAPSMSISMCRIFSCVRKMMCSMCGSDRIAAKQHSLVCGSYNYVSLLASIRSGWYKPSVEHTNLKTSRQDDINLK